MRRDIAAQPLLSVIAPVYNEADIVEQFADELLRTLNGLNASVRHEILFVNDGSTDASGEKLEELCASYPAKIKVIHLARNFGHDAAVCAGLDVATGDAVILMDSDLQDDPVGIGKFLEKWFEGYDVVYAVRSSRQEPALLRGIFRLFYRILGLLANIPIPADAGNYALMDRRVVDSLVACKERNRYLPGLRSWVGFRQIGVPVPRRARYDKRSRVGLRGLWRLAMNAIFSFSYVPILLFRIVGLLSLAISLGLILLVLYHKFFTGLAVVAWASQLVAIAFFGGINLLGISVLGEYVARIYDEVRGRPIYIIDRMTDRTSGGAWRPDQPT